MVDHAWLIPALPLATFVLVAAFGRSPTTVHTLGTAGVGAAWLATVVTFAEALTGRQVQHLVVWFRLGQTPFTIGWVIDPLAAIMLAVVATVSLLVHIYSVGYMHGDRGYRRYFAFLNLFTAAMLGLVLAPTLLQLFVFWELVGLCSYLLIGHWYEKPEAAAAAKKAFLVTRFGDLGFLIGILLLWTATGTFVLTEVAARVVLPGAMDQRYLTLALLLLFCGAIGKSAQFPLHTWLPDAMEGPTPVSALIHAATMVAAGVYLVARTFPLFHAAPDALLVVAYLGMFTALFAATMGLVAHDIKRVLAYSTISQLGYMLAGLGVGSLSAGMFHLVTHAFFKALLFLAAGSVIHGTGTQDLRNMGGLRRAMPLTCVTFSIGALALAGVPPLSGFFSKDEILASALAAGQPALFATGVFTAALTAFYIARAWLLAFAGSPRWQIAVAVHDTPHAHRTPHEAPLVMTLPLLILAALTALAGLLGPVSGHWFSHFVAPADKPHPFEPSIAALGTLAAAAGLSLAWLMYGARRLAPDAVAARLRPLYIACVRGWWIDDVYALIVRRIILALAWLMAWFDTEVIDAVVNATATAVRATGRAVRRLQTGSLPAYGLAIYVGVVVIALVILLAPR